MRLNAAVLSDTGLKRKINEDSYGYFEHEKLFIVSDGMGGHAAGKTASETAVASIKDFCVNREPDKKLTPVLNAEPTSFPTAGKLTAAVEFANQRIYQTASDNPMYHGMGATVVALLFAEHSVAVCSVGDSRVYRIRNGIIEQITSDHSLVAELVKSRDITPEEAKVHPHKNIITRALGGRENVLVDTLVEECCDNDCFILCSDGLTNMVEDEEILQAVLIHSDLNAACRYLVDLANERGGSDNITVLTVKTYL